MQHRDQISLPNTFPRMAQRTILNANIAAKLLNQDIWTTFTSKQTEEHRHPWQVSQFQRFNRPLFVVWDHSIWTPPGEDGSMRATGDRERLDTRESRMNILANHVNKKIGYPTPIISFTISAIEVQDFAHARLWEKGRGSPIVTVINPNTRLKKGLPTLRLLDEMTAYGVPPPPWKKSEFYKHQYICLWEITKEEIVGHWKWEDLGRHFTWYQHIIMNAFRQHDGITIKTDPMAIFLPRLSRESNL